MFNKKNMRWCLPLFLTMLLLSSETAKSQHDAAPIDVSSIQKLWEIKQCQLFVDTSNNIQMGSLMDIKWIPYGDKAKIYPPNKWITKTIYLKFKIENPLDTPIKIYFIAGAFVKSTKIYQLSENHQIVQLEDLSHRDGLQPIQINQRGKFELIAKIKFSKRENNIINPRLISSQYLAEYKILKHHSDDWRIELGFITCGLLFLIMLYNGYSYLGDKNKTFLYGFLYSSSMLLLEFLVVFLKGKNGDLHSFFNEYFDFALRTISIIFYIEFTRSFLNTSSNFHSINVVLKTGVFLFTTLLLLNTYIVYFTDLFELQIIIDNLQHILMIVTGIIYVSLAFFRKNILVNYIAGGNLIFITFSILAICIDYDIIMASGELLQSAILFDFGVIGDLLLFSSGIAYKKKTQLLENIKRREEMETQNIEIKLALLQSKQDERNRISAEMHDDLGAGITTIRLYSELAKKRMGNKVIPEIEKISSSANELINNMNTIIWTMSSSNDSLHNMIAYLRNYALEYFEDTGINCIINVEENIPDTIVIGERRRNVFLVIKEILNNIIKHAQATEVKITLKIENGYLALEIHDNGIGINLDNLRKFGNGLINIKKRMEEMQIEFTIANKHGTIVTLKDKVEN